MKKLVLIICFLILTAFMQVKADVVPLSSRSIIHYGIGVLNVPSAYKIYKEPNLKSEIIREVNNAYIKKSAIIRSSNRSRLSYIAYVPSNNIALFAVESNPDENWYNVYLNQKTGETGWIYNENANDFMTYRQLFYRYGKPYGIRFFNDLSEETRVLYSSENKNSKKVDDLTFPKFATFTVIRGNWILTTVNDLSGQAKVGWFNWRNDDGTLNMFPNFKEE